MDARRLLHPLPVVLIFLFIAVAVGDLLQKLTEEPPPLPEIVGSAVPRFEALEPVIDFRADRGDRSVEVLPTPALARGQWSAPRPSGVWARGPEAELIVDLGTGGHRMLILEGMPTSGKDRARELQLTVNGVDCGRVALQPGWEEYRFDLPEGVLRPGSNRLGFGFPKPSQSKRKSRELLVRRLGLFLDAAFDGDVFKRPRPAVTLDFDADSVTIRCSGTLEMPLVLEDRTDALQMRYRFASATGRVDIEVAQSKAGEPGSDDAVRSSVSADKKATGRIRLPLHGRRGAYVLRVRAELVAPDNRLLLSSLRLVEEGDPTRRPPSASPHPS